MSMRVLQVHDKLDYHNMSKLLIDAGLETGCDAFIMQNPMDSKTVINLDNIKDVSVFKQEEIPLNGTNNISCIVNNEKYINSDQIRRIIARDLLMKRDSPYINLTHSFAVIYGDNMIQNNQSNFNWGTMNENGFSRCSHNPTKQLICTKTKMIYQLTNNIGYGGLGGIISVIRGGMVIDHINADEGIEVGKLIRQGNNDYCFQCQMILNHNCHYCTDPANVLSMTRSYLVTNQSLVIAPGSIVQACLDGMFCYILIH